MNRGWKSHPYIQWIFQYILKHCGTGQYSARTEEKKHSELSQSIASAL
jgi:hypothetical protein